MITLMSSGNDRFHYATSLADRKWYGWYEPSSSMNQHDGVQVCCGFPDERVCVPQVCHAIALFL